ncbi:hypothetical protein BSLG_005694 [Batrachochytrium salamandrivorans]|nr:hypothetical protein BSLG_005694 [Batrachochytrium salamandrivorans]
MEHAMKESIKPHVLRYNRQFESIESTCIVRGLSFRGRGHLDVRMEIEQSTDQRSWPAPSLMLETIEQTTVIPEIHGHTPVHDISVGIDTISIDLLPELPEKPANATKNDDDHMLVHLLHRSNEHFDYEEEDAWIREQKRVLFGNTNESTKECISIQPTTPSLLTPTVASNLRTNSVSSKTKSKPYQYAAPDSHASDTESEHRIPAVKPSSGVYSANTVENRPLSRLDALFKEQDAATAAYVTKNMPLTDTITPTIISARNESIASSTVATCIDKSEPETVIVEIPVSVEQNVTYSKITPTVELEVVCAEPLIPLTTEVSTTGGIPTATSTTSSTRAKTVHSLEIQLPTEPVAVLQIQTSNSEPVLQTLKPRNQPLLKVVAGILCMRIMSSQQKVLIPCQRNRLKKMKSRTDHLKETTASKSVQDIDTQNTEATSLVIQPVVNVTVEPVMGTNASHFQSTETIALQDQTAAENRKSTPTAFVAIPAETAETKAYPAPTNKTPADIKYTDMDVSIGPNSGRYFNAMQMHHLQGADYETYNSNTKNSKRLSKDPSAIFQLVNLNSTAQSKGKTKVFKPYYPIELRRVIAVNSSRKRGMHAESMARSVLILVEKSDKESGKLIEKYVKEVAETSKRPLEIKIVLACEIDPVDAALGIVRSSIGKSNINVLHVSGVTLKREEGKMGGFLNKFK